MRAIIEDTVRKCTGNANKNANQIQKITVLMYVVGPQI